MARRGRELEFNDEEVEDLADMRYGNRLTFALLSLLFPFVNLRDNFHVDHIFPAARLTDRRLKEAWCCRGEGTLFQGTQGRACQPATAPRRGEHGEERHNAG